METFRRWVEEVGQARVALLLGCSSSLVSHWLCGRKRMTEDWAPKIEVASGGRVRCEDLFPSVEWERVDGVVVGYQVSVNPHAARSALGEAQRAA